MQIFQFVQNIAVIWNKFKHKWSFRLRKGPWNVAIAFTFLNAFFIISIRKHKYMFIFFFHFLHSRRDICLYAPICKKVYLPRGWFYLDLFYLCISLEIVIIILRMLFAYLVFKLEFFSEANYDHIFSLYVRNILSNET